MKADESRNEKAVEEGGDEERRGGAESVRCVCVWLVLTTNYRGGDIIN